MDRGRKSNGGKETGGWEEERERRECKRPIEGNGEDRWRGGNGSGGGGEWNEWGGGGGG